MSTGEPDNSATKTTLLIACGALAHELVDVLNASNWSHVEIQCLPAEWHNYPDKIAPGVESKILENKHKYDTILVAYGDCGTGGLLDVVLEKHQVQRLPGDHCYSFFAGQETFEACSDEELGTFYLTDYLAWHFDRLILETMGINKHPELRDIYFGNYTRVLYLAQTHNKKRLAQAEAAAAAIGLPLAVRYTGLEPLHASLQDIRIVAE